jgi:hypothetical protein
LLIVLGTVFSVAYLSWNFLEKKMLKGSKSKSALHGGSALRAFDSPCLVSLFFDFLLPALDGTKSCGLLYGVAKMPCTTGNIILTA